MSNTTNPLKDGDRVKSLKDCWYKRNPSHENNADSGEDMFWGTVLMVIDDFNASKESNTDCSRSFLACLEENYQAQIAGFYNDDKTDEERKIRNAVIEEYQDLIAIYKSKYTPANTDCSHPFFDVYKQGGNMICARCNEEIL